VEQIARLRRYRHPCPADDAEETVNGLIDRARALVGHSDDMDEDLVIEAPDAPLCGARV